MVKIIKIFDRRNIFYSIEEYSNRGKLKRLIKKLPFMTLKYNEKYKREMPPPSRREVDIRENSKGIEIDVRDYVELIGTDVGETTGSGDYLYKDGKLKEILPKKGPFPKPYTYGDYLKKHPKIEKT
jgi:hypothetical protein